MTEYTKLTPIERYELLERTASELFQTDRWKTKLAERYGITQQAVQSWHAKQDAPLWAVRATADALDLQRLSTAREAVRNAFGFNH